MEVKDETLRAYLKEVKGRRESKEEYLMHLWDVNRKWMSRNRALQIAAERSGFDSTTAKGILKKNNLYY